MQGYTYFSYFCSKTIYVLSKNKKNIKIFQLKIVQFLKHKNLCLLHGHVFVMVAVTVTDGAECCKAFLADNTQFCADYCCYGLSTKTLIGVECCSDINRRVPESQRDTECIDWFKEHM